MLTNSEILDGAAGFIERDGFWNGDGPTDGRNCALMGIHLACKGIPALMDPASNLLRTYVGEWVAMWNDRSTGPEVISTLRAVAMVERAREARLMPVVTPVGRFTSKGKWEAYV